MQARGSIDRSKTTLLYQISGWRYHSNVKRMLSPGNDSWFHEMISYLRAVLYLKYKCAMNWHKLKYSVYVDVL